MAAAKAAAASLTDAPGTNGKTDARTAERSGAKNGAKNAGTTAAAAAASLPDPSLRRRQGPHGPHSMTAAATSSRPADF